MDYKITNLPKSQAEIEVTLPFAELEPHIKRAAVSISEEIDIEGFRRGKAPYEKVKGRVGESSIYERGAELAVRKTYPEVLEKIMQDKGQEFTPIGRPEVTITKLAPGNELQYKVVTALLPKIILPDYKAIARDIKKDKKEITVTDEEVQKTLEWIQDSRTKLITVDRPAQSGDAVEVDFEVRHGGVNPHTITNAERNSDKGGHSFGVGVKIDEQRNYPLILGKEKFIPGFEDQLVGMKSGDEKTFVLKTPDDWYEKSFAGKTLDFTVQMKMVQERQKPEVNNEFAQGLGNFADLEALKTSIRGGLVKEKEDKETQRIRSAIIEKIAREAIVEPPEVLISAELDKMLAELQNGIQGMGMTWEDYLLHIKKTPEGLKKDWIAEAEKRVRSALSLREIARIENISANEEEITIKANEFLRNFQSSEEAEKKVDPEELREYTRGVIRNEKVFEFLENV